MRIFGNYGSQLKKYNVHLPVLTLLQFKYFAKENIVLHIVCFNALKNIIHIKKVTRQV